MTKSKRLTVSSRSNIIPTKTPVIKKPRPNSKRLTKLTTSSVTNKNALATISSATPASAVPAIILLVAAIHSETAIPSVALAPSITAVKPSVLILVLVVAPSSTIF